MSATRAEAFFDTENLFYGFRPQPPSPHPAIADLKVLLPREATDRPGDAGRMFRVLRDVLDWQLARTATTPTAVRSYGKTVDAAVRLLQTEAQEIGIGYAETDRGMTPDPHRGERPLYDFAVGIDLRFGHPLPFAHVDVPAGRDEAELRLLADLRAAQDTGELPDQCVVGSGDNKVMSYVDQLSDGLRARFLIVLPAPSADIRTKIGSTYPHVNPGDVALVSELRVLAAKARQHPSSRRPRRPEREAHGPRRATAPRPEIETVTALLAVDWPALSAARYGTLEWVTATASLAIVDAVERSFAHPEFAARFDAPTRIASIRALRGATLSAENVRFLVACAVLHDTLRRAPEELSTLRRTIGTGSSSGFLRHSLTGVLPLFPSGAQTP